MFKQAEYIWLDGSTPTQELRSKTRIIDIGDGKNVNLETFPKWSYDGSSTYQSDGSNSDLLLEPVNFVRDPIREGDNYLVICEVLNADGTPHETNQRARLRAVLDAGGAEHEPWIGFEQEYTLFEGRRPLGWPEGGYPAPQGPFYCGVGTEQVYGRPLVEAHTQACLDAGIMIYGLNAEVMPGQWEFQIGYRGFDGESADPLNIADHVWFARWLLHRLGENFGVSARLDNKPVKGDWNGAGSHTNFSTRALRDKKEGRAAIEQAIERLGAKHAQHITVYGDGLQERLTGLHETCAIDEFRSGVSDRGASVRIPLQVANQGYGYIEDRRPGANANPYVVAAALVSTVCGIDLDKA